MDFIHKAEQFFIQLQYCIAIEHDTTIQGKKGLYSLMLEPDIFFKLITDFNIEYPFIPKNKIIELKGLMQKEGINTKDALNIIENYKNQYWVLDIVVMFEPVIDKLKRTLKSINADITDLGISTELLNYQEYLQDKREKIFIELCNELNDFPPQPVNKNASNALELKARQDDAIQARKIQSSTKDIRKRERIISEYLVAVERTLQLFGFNRDAEIDDQTTIISGTSNFINALRELYLSDDKDKDEKYEVIFKVINKASFHICKENFSQNPTGTYWASIIFNLDIAYSHISELHFKETNNHYPFPINESEHLPPPTGKSQFSALQWAAIFYYADTTKLLPEGKTIADKMKEFMSKHQVQTTLKTFRTRYYDAQKRINSKNDFPIKKLEQIIPFLSENYKQTVAKVKNDIDFLKENIFEY